MAADQFEFGRARNGENETRRTLGEEDDECQRDGHQRAEQRRAMRITERVRLGVVGRRGDGLGRACETTPGGLAAAFEEVGFDKSGTHDAEARAPRRRSQSASAMRALKTWQRQRGALAQVQRRQPQAAARNERERAVVFGMG